MLEANLKFLFVLGRDTPAELLSIGLLNILAVFLLFFTGSVLKYDLKDLQFFDKGKTLVFYLYLLDDDFLVSLLVLSEVDLSLAGLNEGAAVCTDLGIEQDNSAK